MTWQHRRGLVALAVASGRVDLLQLACGPHEGRTSSPAVDALAHAQRRRLIRAAAKRRRLH